MTDHAPRAPEEHGGWLANLSLDRKIVLAFGLVLLLFGLSTIAFDQYQTRVNEARDAAAQSYETIEAISALEGTVLDQTASLSGYLLTLEDEYLDAYQLAGTSFDVTSQRVRRLAADNAVQQQKLTRIDELMRQWRRELADPQIARLSEGAPPRAELERLRRDRGAALVQDIRREVQALKDDELRILDERAAQVGVSDKTARAVALLSLIGGLLFSALVVFLIARFVTLPIRQMAGLMEELAKGGTEIAIPGLERGDEVGVMARAMQVLRQAKTEADRAAWIKAGIAQLSASFQAAATRQELGTLLVNGLSELLQAGYGAVFLMDEKGQALEWLSGYGYTRRGSVPTRFRLGEGLVGQCAQAKKRIAVAPVPPDYVRISSGLGEGVPQALCLNPVFGTRGGVLGVVELASFTPFSGRHFEFLDEVLHIAGLALESVSRNDRTQELLHETTAQAEELQASEQALRAQQEELRATNDALEVKNKQLEEQRRKLADSEQALQVQAEELKVTNEELNEKSRALDAYNQRLHVAQETLEQKARELESASRYKSEFLANMSHELRTPLNSLLILARALADNEEGNLSPEQVESARVIHESGKNLLLLINDILDLSKIEAGRMEFLLEEIRIADFTGGLERSFRHVAKERGVGFAIHVRAEAPAVLQTDGVKLGQVLNNLLSNAFKFTERGGVTVVVGRPDSATGLPPDLKPESAVAIAVTDTGIGIPPDKLDKVFAAFEQVDASTARKYGGTGLGLAISRSLVRMLGGELLLHSKLGAGSTFTVVLPEKNSKAAAAAKPMPKPEPVAAAAVPAPAPAVAAPAGTAILVVEDDPIFAGVLAKQVEKRGYRVLVAGDGASALRLAAEQRPTGIILDVGLPDIDGWVVMQRLKADPLTQNIPVHFVSAHDDSARGLDMGAVGFMTKPVTRESINQALDKVLQSTGRVLRKVLVVEDDAIARAAMRKLLEPLHVQLVEAETAAQGRELLAREKPDCMVLDFSLPDQYGLAFLEQVKQAGHLPPVVIQTGRELTQEENLRLREYTDSIVVKAARSAERLLDEVNLFLHSITPQGRTPPRPAEAGGDLAGTTVLVVDDDMRNIFALSKALRGRGMQVVMAQDGDKALGQLRANPRIDVVLMDIMMPIKDGYQTMREIRAEAQWQNLPIIAVSAKAMKGDREKCIEAGANDYLSKPIDIDQLTALMRVWLAKS